MGIVAESKIYEYIEQNNLLYDAVHMLVFNTLGFCFIPLCKPFLVQSTGERLPHFAFGANGHNVLESEYQFQTLMLDISTIKGGNQLLNHPEHIYGYVSAYQNCITLEYHYDRGPTGRMTLIKAALNNFLDTVGIDSVEKLLNCIQEAKSRMDSVVAPMAKYPTPQIGGEEVLFCDEVINSYSRKYAKNNIDRLKILFRKGIALSESSYYSNLCITTDSMVTFPGYDETRKEGKIKGIVAQMTNIPKAPISTPLNSDIAIINKNDRISDILYNAALKIRATDYLFAVGYAYDSGLHLLSPAMMATRFSAEKTDNAKQRRAELVIGSLQHYDGQKRIKQMSRASAQRLNDFKKSICLKKVYTCPSAFYHGKFYYLASDQEAYVIMGSSNITKPAYEKNYEFDIIYHFTKTDDGCANLEKQFLDWYEELISNCIELNMLDESLFPSSTAQDENNESSRSSFYRSLESAEERERYSLLEGYQPSRISEYIFKGNAYRAFKKYVLFEYAARGISILEGFSYGNSCYILSIDREEDIKALIAWKSKEQIKNAEVFIADIQHDSEYSRRLREVFERYAEEIKA